MKRVMLVQCKSKREQEIHRDVTMPCVCFALPDDAWDIIGLCGAASGVH